MNANELAQILDMHPDTIRRLIREGKIKATKKGRSYEVDPKEVNSLLNSKSVSARHAEVAKSFYNVKEQIETLQVSELVKLLKELENLQDWPKMRNMAMRSDEEYLNFVEFAFDSWQQKRFSLLVSIIDNLKKYDELIEENEKVKNFSEQYTDLENVLDIKGDQGDDD